MEDMGIRETLREKEREWREQGYPVDKARALSEAYYSYFVSCYGPDEYDVPDEFGQCRQALMRDTDFGLIGRYFALAQEMALRYLNKEFRTVLWWAYRWVLEGIEYEYWYTGRCGGGSAEEAVSLAEQEYEDCLERERQERKWRQEDSPLPQGYRRGCVEVLAILELAGQKELEQIPKQLLELLERNGDPYYEFRPEKGKVLKDMELLPETKGLLAMIYRNYWCTEEGREEYDRMLLENERKYRQRLVAPDDALAEETGLPDLDGLFTE